MGWTLVCADEQTFDRRIVFLVPQLVTHEEPMAKRRCFLICVIRVPILGAFTLIGPSSRLGVHIMAGRVRTKLIGLFVFLSWIIAIVGEPAWGQTGTCCTCPGICQEVADLAACAVLDGAFVSGGSCDPNICPGAVPVNDDCANATVVSGVPGDGSALFVSDNNICATDDGPPLLTGTFLATCAVSETWDGEMQNDIWYEYTTEHCGFFEISTCRSAGGDATNEMIMAIYDGEEGCPQDAGVELSCGHHGCIAEADIGTTDVGLWVRQGEKLLIRVGGLADEGGLPGISRGFMEMNWFFSGFGACTTCWLEPGLVIRTPPEGYVVDEYPPRNRYLKLSDCGAPAYLYDVEVTLDSSLVNGVTAIGSQWWANQPDENCISIVGSTRPASPPDWSACPTFYLAGCAIIPTSTYTITAMTDSMQATPIEARTQVKPGVKWHGDSVGSFTGPSGIPPNVWTPPNLVVNIDDALAAIKTFQDPHAANATHVSITDVHPNQNGTQPNKTVNFDDVFVHILGFQGQEYPGPDLTQCP